MKGENTRNFEAGVLSCNKDFVKKAAEQFDSVWIRLRASANVNNFLSCKRAQLVWEPTAKAARGRSPVGTRLDVSQILKQEETTYRNKNF